MNRNRREVTLPKESVQLGCTKGALHEYDDLVELEVVEQVVQLAVLLSLAKLDVVLLQTVQGKLRLVIDVDLERVAHELLADRAGFLGQGGAEHHDLLGGRSSTEDLLYITTHVYQDRVSPTYMTLYIRQIRTNLIEHLVALVEDEHFDAAKAKLLLTHKSIESSRSTDNDMRMGILVGQDLNVLLHGRAAVEDRGLHIRKILAEAGVLVLDLVGQLTSVAEDQDSGLASNGFELLQSGEDEHSRLTKTRLRLAENVGTDDSLRNAVLLDCCGEPRQLEIVRPKRFVTIRSNRASRPSISQRVIVRRSGDVNHTGNAVFARASAQRSERLDWQIL